MLGRQYSAVVGLSIGTNKRYQVQATLSSLPYSSIVGSPPPESFGHMYGNVIRPHRLQCCERIQTSRLFATVRYSGVMLIMSAIETKCLVLSESCTRREIA
jgi:hypothetical protein